MTRLNYNTLGTHPAYPERIWVVVEQPKGARVAYDAVTQTFVRTERLSLLHIRGFSGVYGWIAGTGIPPDPHFDALLLTDDSPAPGAVVEGFLAGVFLRADGDHKFLAVGGTWKARMGTVDLAALPGDALAEVLRLYPRVGPGEGWFGLRSAMDVLATGEPTHV